MTIESLPTFTKLARKRWESIPVTIRQRLLSNVWCGHCRVNLESAPTVDNRLMDFFFLAFFATIGVYAAKTAEQRQRIALLGSYLQKFQLEKHMEQLIDGYLRALGENDPQRSAPIWSNLESIEAAVREELARLADDLHEVWGERTRVSRWPVAVPFANRLFPASTFDLRTLLKVHAKGFDTTLRNDDQLVRRDQAFRLTAELMLFQHSCHWFCRSRTVASARLMARHKTAYDQVLSAVSPETRRDYLDLVQA